MTQKDVFMDEFLAFLASNQLLQDKLTKNKINFKSIFKSLFYNKSIKFFDYKI